MRKLFLIACVLALPARGVAQMLRLDNLDRLAAKASETVNVTLDGSLLQMASRFISDDGDSDTAEVKRLVAGLKGISIRSFEFKNAGEYADADIEAIRSQLKDDTWKRIVQVHSKTEGDSDIYLKTVAGRIAGLAVIAAEPKQLTVVSIDGAMDLEGLSKLGGNFGIPKSIRKRAEDKAK